MTMRFHAHPAPGEWMNDPNALIRTDAGWLLLAQHRDDAPQYQATGWGRWHSPDLLHWTWQGLTIAPDGEHWAFSGSVVRDGAGQAQLFYTLHSPHGEEQRRLLLSTDGANTTPAPLAMPATACDTDRRDPFVFYDGQQWCMLLADPVGWHDWQTHRLSAIRAFVSDDLATWRGGDVIMQCREPGVMWEVPILIDLGGVWALAISVMDRRGDRSTGEVRYWLGAWHDGIFNAFADQPADGQPIDHGPDFYAAMLGERDGNGPLIVGWGSSWQTARHVQWPGFAGGPISLPRRLGFVGRGAAARITVQPFADVGRDWPVVERPPTAGRVAFSAPADAIVAIIIEQPEATLALTVDPDSASFSVDRAGDAHFTWARRHILPPIDAPTRDMILMIDGPLVEYFDRTAGIAATTALPQSGGSVRVLVNGDPISLRWQEAPQ